MSACYSEGKSQSAEPADVCALLDGAGGGGRTDRTSHVESQRRSEQGNRRFGGKTGHSINTLLVFLSTSAQFFMVGCRKGAELGNERNAWKYQWYVYLVSSRQRTLSFLRTDIQRNTRATRLILAGLPPLEGRPAAPLACPGLVLSRPT